MIIVAPSPNSENRLLDYSITNYNGLESHKDILDYVYMCLVLHSSL